MQRPVCIIHYVAHNPELAILEAMTKFPYLATFEESVKSDFEFYFYSLTRNGEVNEIAVILNQDAIYYS